MKLIKYIFENIHILLMGRRIKNILNVDKQIKKYHKELL